MKAVASEAERQKVSARQRGGFLLSVRSHWNRMSHQVSHRLAESMPASVSVVIRAKRVTKTF